MKTLVTGGAGFIGSHLVDRLISDGHKVIVIDNESASSNEKFYWNSAAENYKYDVSTSNECAFAYMGRLFSNVDVVFHLAADARIQPSLLNPVKTMRNNIMGTSNMLEMARANGVKRFVYSSTSAAYGLLNTPPLIETMPTDCLNPYSVSKVAGEEMCKMYARLYGMETVTFRYFNVYGERQPLCGQYAPVIGIFLRQKAAGEQMTIVGDGTQRRDFTYVGDVVEANIKASIISKDPTYQWGQVYNIGTGTNYSINEITAIMGGDTVTIPSRPAESLISLANANKAKEHLGWTSKVRLEEWIAAHK